MDSQIVLRLFLRQTIIKSFAEMESTWKTKWIVFEVYGKDTRPGMLRNYFRSATCVQRFDDSLSCAIRITYRSSQRSSSIREPRDPPLKVVRLLCLFGFRIGFWFGVLRGFWSLKMNWDNKKVHGLFVCGGFTLMILPQVHLRKPCYDFSFL